MNQPESESPVGPPEPAFAPNLGGWHNIGPPGLSKTIMINPGQIAAIAAALAVLSACSKPPDPPTAAPKPKTDAVAAANAAAPAATPTEGLHQVGGIAWQKGDVDAAFAAAKAQHKPVFLYWGAVWCPPCNQVKATIFNRQDFIERSRFFVPVYIDGDSASAQRLGDRFKVSGYPTMILFTPDGGEITRLPGEVEVDQYMRVLAMGMNGARPVKETLAAALSPGGGGRRCRPTTGACSPTIRGTPTNIRWSRPKRCRRLWNGSRKPARPPSRILRPGCGCGRWSPRRPPRTSSRARIKPRSPISPACLPIRDSRAKTSTC